MQIIKGHWEFQRRWVGTQNIAILQMAERMGTNWNLQRDGRLQPKDLQWWAGVMVIVLTPHLDDRLMIDCAV